MSASAEFVTSRGKLSRAAGLVAGVLLPAAALAVELSTGMCAEVLFDPLWTPAHVALVAAVPSAYLWLWLWWTGRVPLPRYAGLLAGFALVVAFYYALIFLPLTPLAVVGIVIYGLGLLALAPLAATIIGLLVCSTLRDHGISRRSLAAGGLVAALALVAAEAPAFVNTLWSSWAASPDGPTRLRGLALLRRWGDRDAMLEACYRSNATPGFLPWLSAHWLLPPTDTAKAREVYYRVTGEPFQLRPPPRLRSLREGFGRDEDQGGREVGGHVRALSLSSSRFDTSIDSSAAVGYTEWTLVFHNADPVQRAEARAEIELPEGAVVSRATLWVQGEPREAAFAGAGKAREAYAGVVRQARDPLLVTQPSPGRVLVQCFPVEPHAEMKIRIGISFPLTPIGDRRTRFRLPFFADRNFEVQGVLAHHVWVEATGRLESSHPSLTPESDGTRLRGDLPAAALAALSFEAAWPGPVTHWALDPSEPAAGAASASPPWAAVIQNFRPLPAAPLPHLVLVVDSSRSLAEHADGLARLLSASRLPLTLVLATDADPELQRIPGPGAARQARLAELLEARRFVGGKDNVAALSLGFEQARVLGADAVLWLHGPQPLVLSSPQALTQLLDRGQHAADLVPIGVGAGTNRVLLELDSASIRRPSWRGSALATLDGYLDARASGTVTWSAERTWVAPLPELPASSKTSAHLVRLWAAERVASGCGGLTRAACVALAVRHQLVTAVSGAVVLESAAQYDAAGLAPVDPATVPSIPEPETWLLLCAALLALLGADRLARSGRRLWIGA